MWEEAPAPYHPTVVDVAFALEGKEIPFDHGQLLWQELTRVLPGLAMVKNIGVHPIRGARTERDTVMLSKRANLTIRLPRAMAEKLAALSGAHLNLGESTLIVGKSKLRELAPHSAIHSHFVTTGHPEETAFAADIEETLKARDIPCKMVCGKSNVFRTADGETTVYSLALYGLSDEQSLALQETGLGIHHEIGCGVFVPHKSFTAVGA